MNYLFFSAESEPPAGYMLMNVVKDFEKYFNNIHQANEYSDKIDSVCIVFICVSDSLLSDGFCRERKYISHKKRYADIRLLLPYLPFITASKEEQLLMCWHTIEKAIGIIGLRVNDFQTEKLLTDIQDAMKKTTKN